VDPEHLLYMLYKAGGINTLFACGTSVFSPSYSSPCLCPKKHVAAIPLAVLILLVGAKMATSGIRIKAELFSFIFMTAMVWVWFRVKSSSRDPGETGRYLWYVYPVLMLLWVNSHGGFIFGLAFLATLGVGEAMNRLTGSAQMLAPQTRRHLFTAILLSFVAVLFNPYGWAYPAQLLDSLILNPGEFSRHVKTVMEYQTIFFPAARHLLFMDAMVIAVCILVALLAVHIRRHRPDWTIILINTLFMIIYMRYLRTTYFWGIIFVFTALYLLKEACRSYPGLLSEKPRSYFLQALIVCALLVFSARAYYYALVSPDFGFRVNYQNTFTEAEFIRESFPDITRIGNDYNPGAYLIWALGPGKKVLIDSRYFPYAPWYDEYNEFFTTRDNAVRRKFLEKYRTDLWVCTYDSPHLEYFLSSPDWRLVFYGPSACVFISRGTAYPEGVKVSQAISGVSFHQALRISGFAVQVKNYGLAMDLLTSIRPMPFSKDQKSYAVGALGKAADAMFSDNRLDAANTLYARILTMDPSSTGAYFMMGRVHLKMKNTQEAIRCFRESVRLDPRSVKGRLNLANAYILIDRWGEAVREYSKAQKSHLLMQV
jgi:tetratricopeptide (TPR) repeat protein